MILPVIKYGHPTLRKKGARIDRVTPDLSKLIDDMLETMYDASGIGLAAQQVDHAIQLTVIDVRGVEDRPSTMSVRDEPVDVDSMMPLVLINPEITPVNDLESGPEGCLSFPEIYGEIARPESVDVSAMNRNGASIQFRCGGLLARAVQHETDHLNGILFIDRMSASEKSAIRNRIDALHSATKESLANAAI